MKKIIIFLILILIGGLVGLGVWFGDESNTDTSDIGTSTETNGSQLNIEELAERVKNEPFFDFEETEIVNEISDEFISSRPSRTVKAIYYTSYSASSENKIRSLIQLASTTEINAVVIDVNNFTGRLAYDSAIPEVDEYNLDTRRITDLPALIDRLQSHGIYTIARITVMQNTAVAEARPDLALQSSSTGGLWYDTSDQAWLDPSSEKVWRYVGAVAQEVSSFGFDEVNFDYIRFPSDGDLEDIVYPSWNEESLKVDVLDGFFRYLRKTLPDTTLSIDVFGLITVNRDGLGIGQLLEDAFRSFDVVAPMVYPSHYADGSFGIQNPAENPYEIILVSLVNSVLRVPGIETFDDYRKKKKEFNVEIRPWLQDFDIGAEYGPKQIRQQIQAAYDALGEDAGFMIWNSRNVYTWSAFEKSGNENE